MQVEENSIHVEHQRAQGGHILAQGEEKFKFLPWMPPLTADCPCKSATPVAHFFPRSLAILFKDKVKYHVKEVLKNPYFNEHL